ncbi:MAG TPA: hypothetical protein VKR29_06610 [Candidatus Binataceae bacterium]|nr:hypothetical protein [Candidatus Binataceae bacterium]
MISADQIRALAATLGTPEGLARVDAEMLSLRDALMNPHRTASRDELAHIATALEFLRVAFDTMESIAGHCIVQLGAGTVNCVG